jgi:hypothetical protein
MGAYEERAEVMRLAVLLNDFKREGIELHAKLNALISRLVGEADRLLPAAADERSEAPKTKAIRYRKGPASVEEHEAEETVIAVAAAMGRKKPRKPRKPMTEEDRVKMLKHLEKARAARKPK